MGIRHPRLTGREQTQGRARAGPPGAALRPRRLLGRGRGRGARRAWTGGCAVSSTCSTTRCCRTRCRRTWPAPARGARDRGRGDVHVVSRPSVDGEAMADNAILEVLPDERGHGAAGPGVGGVEAGRGGGRGPGPGAGPAAQRGGAGGWAPATTSPCRSRVGETGRGPAPRHPRRGRPLHRGAVQALEGRLSTRHSPARFGVARDELAPWHLDDPFFQDPPARGRRRPRRALRRRGPRGAHRAHLRRPGPRRAPDARQQRPLRPGAARTSTPSASTSTGKATSGCSATSSRASGGWRRCSTSSGTPPTTRASTPTWPGWSATPRIALTTEGVAMFVRPAGPLPRVARRRSRACRARPRAARAAPGRGPPRRAAGLRPLGAGRDPLRASPLRRPRRRPRHALVGPGRAVTSWCVAPRQRHAPDWAAKIHLAVVPVYYQNYLYGELFASQLEAHAASRGPEGFVDRPAAGQFLTEVGVRARRVAALGPPGRGRRPGEPLTAPRISPPSCAAWSDRQPVRSAARWSSTWPTCGRRSSTRSPTGRRWSAAPVG